MDGEVRGVGGQGGQKDPLDQKKKVNDPDAFKEMMKVEKISEVDPDQKKNRKRREEDVPEDAPVEPSLAPPPVGFQNLMQDPNDKENLFSIQNVESHFTFNPAPTEGSSEDAFFSVGSTYNEPDSAPSASPAQEPFALGATNEPDSTPSPNPAEQQAQTPLPPPNAENPSQNPNNLLNLGTGSNTIDQDSNQTDNSTTTTTPAVSPSSSSDEQNSSDSTNQPPTKNTTPVGSSKVLSEEEKIPTPFTALPSLASAKQSSDVQLPLDQAKPATPTLANTTEEKVDGISSNAEIKTSSDSKTDTRQGQKDSSKDQKEDTNLLDQANEMSATGNMMPTFVPDATGQPQALPGLEAVTPTFSTAYSNLHPEVLELFDRMVGYVQVVQDSQAQETTVFVNTKNPASVFNGGQIILTEYASAPNTYNIQFVGNPQAVQLFQQNIPMMMSAFEAGHYRFHVHRLEAIYEEEKKEKRGSQEGQEKENQDENS